MTSSCATSFILSTFPKVFRYDFKTPQSTSNMSSHDLVTKTSSLSATPNNGSNGSTTFPRSSQGNGRTDEVLDDSDDPNQSLTTIVKSTHNTSPAAEISTAADSVAMHCSVNCKYGRRDAKDMVRCSLCYTWYHEDCIGDHYSRNTYSHWWLCIKCRQMPNTLVTLNDTVLQLSGYVSQLIDKILTEMVNKVKQSNSKIKAELSNIQKSTDQDRNSREISNDSPSLILGDSTIRDIVPNNEHRLYVCSKGGAKASDILAMLKKGKTKCIWWYYDTCGNKRHCHKIPRDKNCGKCIQHSGCCKRQIANGKCNIKWNMPSYWRWYGSRQRENINATMASLASDKGCNFIDHMDTFVSRNGEVIEDFLLLDGLHLSASGTRKLMHNLGVSDGASGRLDAPKTTNSTWSRQSNHKRRQNLDSRHLTFQPPGRPAGSDHGQQGVTGHHRGEQAMVPQPYANPDAHRKRNWYRGRNDGDSTSGHYQRQQGSQRSNDFHKDDNVKSYCELCGKINHTTQQCRHRNPISCHKCQRFGHKMKFCNWYRWIFGHGSHNTSRISDVDSIVDSCHCGKIADATCRKYLNINSGDNFIQASPRIEDSAPRVDMKCVNVDYEGWVSYLLGRIFSGPFSRNAIYLKMVTVLFKVWFYLCPLCHQTFHACLTTMSWLWLQTK